MPLSTKILTALGFRQASPVLTSLLPQFAVDNDTQLNFMLGKMPDEYNSNEELYRLVTTVYACVAAISQTIAQCKFNIIDQRGGKAIDYINDPELDIFARPNPWQTYYEFWENTFGFLELAGECPWLLGRDRRGLVQSMIPIRPDRLTIIPSATNFIEGYIFNVSGEQFDLRSEDVVFWKYFNPTDNWRGLSPLTAALKDIDLELCVLDANRNIFKHGVKPSGVFSTDQPIVKQEMMDALAEKFNNKYAGYTKYGKAIFLTGGFKWQSMSISAHDMQTMEQRKFSEHKIRQVYRVPPLYTMDLSDASVLANADIQERLFWEINLIPKMRRMEERMNEFVIPQITKRQLIMQFDYSRVEALRKNMSALISIYTNALRHGAVTPNDIRRDVLNKPIIDDPAMNTFYIDPLLMPTIQEPQQSAKINNNSLIKCDNILTQLKGIAKQQSQPFNVTVQAIQNIKTQQKITAFFEKASRQQVQLARLQNEQSQKFYRVVRKLFEGQRDEVLANLQAQKIYKQIDIAAVMFDYQAWIERFEKAGKPHIAESLRLAAQQLIDQTDQGIEFNVADQRVLAFIGMRAHSYAQLVNDTNKARVDEIIRLGIDAGLSINEIATQISGYFDASGHANLVARTETVTSINYGRMEGMLQTGYEYHRWMTQRDSEVRESHMSADGQIVRVGEEFTQLGIDYSGDRTFPSDFNERCWTMPVSTEERTVFEIQNKKEENINGK